MLFFTACNFDVLSARSEYTETFKLSPRLRPQNCTKSRKDINSFKPRHLLKLTNEDYVLYMESPTLKAIKETVKDSFVQGFFVGMNKYLKKRLTLEEFEYLKSVNTTKTIAEQE